MGVLEMLRNGIGTALLIGFWSGSALAARQTFAVVIGNNSAPDDATEPLNYADDDAARWAELLAPAADEVYLLTRFDAASAALYARSSPVQAPPTRANVLATLYRVGERVRVAQAAGDETRLYLVFVGHGVLTEDRMGSLVLEGGSLSRSELMAAVASLSRFLTHRTHLTIDACNAWFMVHDRGTRLAEWRNDRTGEPWSNEAEAMLRGRIPDRLGLVLATSGAQQSHETATLNGGVFSHAVRSALSGAADADGDHRVTYDEVHAFVRAAGASIQHAQAPAVFVRAPTETGAEPVLAVADFRGAAVLALPPGMNGHFRLVDARGLPYAEVNRAGDGPATEIAVVDGGYGWFELNRRRPGTPADAAVFAARPGDRIDASTLTYEPPQPHAARGLLDVAYRDGLFATPYGLGVLNLVRTMSAASASASVGTGHAAPGGRLSVDAGPVIAGAARPGETLQGAAFGATLGPAVEIVEGLGVGVRLQYDGAAMAVGDLKHFVGGVTPRVRLYEGEAVEVDVEALVGVDMVLASREVAYAPDRPADAGTRDQSVFAPGNATGQATMALRWRFFDPLGLRVHAGYTLTSPVDLEFSEDVIESGLMHRPIGGVSLEVAR
jgi:hypothetical protein